MQNKTNILNELKEAGAIVLINADNRNYFYLPDDYFNNLSGNIVSHIFIQSLPHVNPFTIPMGYFENLPEIILEKISVKKNIETSLITDEKNVYTVPEGYFNNFADNILKKIKKSNPDSVQAELEEISPLLNKIPKTNVYSVPENYFADSFSLVSINAKPAAKVISLGSRTRKWTSYAAAACIAALLFVGGYFYYSNKPGSTATTSLAKVDVQKEISNLTSAEIEDYLNNNNNTAVYTNSDDDQQNIDVQDLIQSVSDEEIQQYLNQNPESGKKREGI